MATVFSLLSGLEVGCGVGGDASPMSPTVAADSEAGAKARAQDQKLREERQRQEALLRKRRPGIPTGE